MTSNETRSLPSWRLYVIVDPAAMRGRGLAAVAAAAIRGGADVLQLRDKTVSVGAVVEAARVLLPLTRQAGIPLIINDWVEAAAAVGADGVHLGQDDDSIEEARKRLGPGRLIGLSTHSLAQALAAEQAGADYIGFGPIFPTPTKPDYGSIGLDALRKAASQIRIPMVCVGGIEAGNLDQVLEAGATCVAVVRAVCGAEDPEAATRELKNRLVQSVRIHDPLSL